MKKKEKMRYWEEACKLFLEDEELQRQFVGAFVFMLAPLVIPGVFFRFYDPDKKEDCEK
jgi:hypothetical protein